jgi:hypothetical protein
MKGYSKADVRNSTDIDKNQRLVGQAKCRAAQVTSFY